MAMHTKTETGGLSTIMRNYAMLLGLRDSEAAALAAALAGTADAPKSESEALKRVERAVLDPADADGSDRALIATWLAGQDSDRDLARLPQGRPAATGLSMPAQSLDPMTLNEMAQSFGTAIGMRAEPRRQPARVPSRAR
jgi:hypothetical protein